MFVAYIIVPVTAAAANIFSATLDFIRFKQILVNTAKVGVPESWITMLGTLKAAGAVGLLVGIGVPPIGVAAAIGRGGAGVATSLGLKANEGLTPQFPSRDANSAIVIRHW